MIEKRGLKTKVSPLKQVFRSPMETEQIHHTKLTSIGGTGVKWSCLRLRDLLHLSIKFTGRGLVESCAFLQATGANSIKHTKHTNTVTVSSVLN